MDNLFEVAKGLKTYWASPENFTAEYGNGGKVSRGRKGSANFFLGAGESKVLALAKGSGIIRRMWMTIPDRGPEFMRGVKLEMFWDDSEKPAVSVPLGDFFCQGLGTPIRFENALFSNPEGRSFNCCVPMPFRAGMKIVVTNEADTDVKLFYFDINYTLGDQLPDDMCYFHAYWNREQSTEMFHDYAFLPQVNGRGRFLGVNVGVIPTQKEYFKSWWGEGEMKIYLDGDDEYPSLCGTGTEDYIGTAWGQGQYDQMYQGCHLGDEDNFRYCFYRFHIPDPVYFSSSIRAEMQQIGCWNPDSTKKMQEEDVSLNLAAKPELKKISSKDITDDYGLFEREGDDWSSCAYFYLDKPYSELPALPPVKERTAGLQKQADSDKRADI